MLKRMSANDSFPKNQSDRRTNRKMSRAFSGGFLPSDLLRSRSDNAELRSGTLDHRSLVRSQSESIFSLQTCKNQGSFVMDLKTSKELCCNNIREMETWKLPRIPQGHKATGNLSVNDFREVTPTTPTCTAPQRSSLPDLSKGIHKVVAFRAATPLRQQQVEEVNNKFDSLKSKSQNLAKWLKDQR